MQIPISRESICLDGGGLVLLPMPPSPPQRANKQQGPSGEVEEGPGLNVTSRGGGIHRVNANPVKACQKLWPRPAHHSLWLFQASGAARSFLNQPLGQLVSAPHMSQPGADLCSLAAWASSRHPNLIFCVWEPHS